MASDHRSAETEVLHSSSAYWSAAAGFAAAAGVVGIAVALLMISADTPQSLYVKAASHMALGGPARTALSQAVKSGLADLDDLPCDYGIRDRAGAMAVAYYENLLEKPMGAAGLAMGRNGQCELRSDKLASPFELLLNHRSRGANFKLPWSCMPDSWRTAEERQIQLELEGALASGRLPSEALSGTLASAALSLKRGPLAHECNRATPYYKPNLPLQAAPVDDWDLPRRRR